MTTRPDPYPVGIHRVHLHVGDNYVTGSVTCEAPPDAFCRRTCPHECESWQNSRSWPCGPSNDPHELRRLADDGCQVVTWIEAVGVLDSHWGERQDVRADGLAEITWDDGYVWRYEAAAADVADPAVIDAAHLTRQREFSLRTFGPGRRTAGIVAHMRKELIEILADPDDTIEWIDAAILAFDGAWRTGAEPQQIIDTLIAKQTRNEGRTWPDWRTAPADQAIEHVRTAVDRG